MKMICLPYAQWINAFHATSKRRHRIQHLFFSSRSRPFNFLSNWSSSCLPHNSDPTSKLEKHEFYQIDQWVEHTLNNICYTVHTRKRTTRLGFSAAQGAGKHMSQRGIKKKNADEEDGHFRVSSYLELKASTMYSNRKLKTRRQGGSNQVKFLWLIGGWIRQLVEIGRSR